MNNPFLSLLMKEKGGAEHPEQLYKQIAEKVLVIANSLGITPGGINCIALPRSQKDNKPEVSQRNFALHVSNLIANPIKWLSAEAEDTHCNEYTICIKAVYHQFPVEWTVCQLPLGSAAILSKDLPPVRCASPDVSHSTFEEWVNNWKCERNCLVSLQEDLQFTIDLLSNETMQVGDKIQESPSQESKMLQKLSFDKEDFLHFRSEPGRRVQQVSIINTRTPASYLIGVYDTTDSAIGMSLNNLRRWIPKDVADFFASTFPPLRLQVSVDFIYLIGTRWEDWSVPVEIDRVGPLVTKSVIKVLKQYPQICIAPTEEDGFYSIWLPQYICSSVVQLLGKGEHEVHREDRSFLPSSIRRALVRVSWKHPDDDVPLRICDSLIPGIECPAALWIRLNPIRADTQVRMMLASPMHPRLLFGTESIGGQVRTALKGLEVLNYENSSSLSKFLPPNMFHIGGVLLIPLSYCVSSQSLEEELAPFHQNPISASDWKVLLLISFSDLKEANLWEMILDFQKACKPLLVNDWVVYDPSALESKAPEFSSVAEVPISEDDLAKCYKRWMLSRGKNPPWNLVGRALIQSPIAKEILRESVLHQVQKRLYSILLRRCPEVVLHRLCTA